MAGYIYKHTSPSGMSYIGKSLTAKGQRWQEHVRAAYLESGKEYNYPLQRAIRKYGEDQFEHEILEDDIDESLLSELEVLYIEKHDTFYNGYNQTKGGEGTTGARSIEARERITKANKERIWTEEMRQKTSNTKSGVCLKPWYIIYPDGNKEVIKDVSKKDYAIQKGWHVGNFKNLWARDPGTMIMGGFFKGFTVGNIGDTYE